MEMCICRMNQMAEDRDSLMKDKQCHNGRFRMTPNRPLLTCIILNTNFVQFFQVIGVDDINQLKRVFGISSITASS